MTLETVGTWINCVFRFFLIPINILGFSFTFFDIIIFLGVSSVLIMIFAKLIGGDVG